MPTNSWRFGQVTASKFELSGIGIESREIDKLDFHVVSQFELASVESWIAIAAMLKARCHGGTRIPCDFCQGLVPAGLS
jgi:hypothetical protein